MGPTFFFSTTSSSISSIISLLACLSNYNNIHISIPNQKERIQRKTRKEKKKREYRGKQGRETMNILVLMVEMGGLVVECTLSAHPPFGTCKSGDCWLFMMSQSSLLDRFFLPFCFSCSFISSQLKSNFFWLSVFYVSTFVVYVHLRFCLNFEELAIRKIES